MEVLPPFRIISAYDDKIVKGCQHWLCEELKVRYNSTSFLNFANMVLDFAEEQECSLTTDCQIDAHIR